VRTSRWTALLLALVAAAIVVGTASGGAARHTDTKRPVNVGYLLSLTGVFSASAQFEARGFNLGLKTFGSVVDGHKIHLHYVDDQTDPIVALTLARSLVERDHADVIEGPLASNEVAALASYLGPAGEPTDDFVFCSALQLDYYRKYDYGYSSGSACDHGALMGAVWAAKTKHWKHAVVVVQDLAFGWANGGAFATTFRKLGGTIDKFIYIPINATDFAPYVSQIPTNTNVVFTEMAGAASVRFTKAYKDFGLKGKVPLLGVSQLTDYSSLPAEDPSAILGVYTVGAYCDGLKSPLNNLFTSKYKQAYGTYPGNSPEIGFTKARILVNALRKLKGDASNHKKLIDAMKATKIVAPRGPVSLSPVTLSPIENIYVCQVKNVNGELRNVPVATYPSVPPWGILSRSAWETHFRHDTAAQPG
jgi:branched-chain amino acid transport system substrate-binding protein